MKADVIEKNFISGSDIFELEDIKTVDVLVPEWGDRWVRLRSFRADEAVTFVDASQGANKFKSAARMVALCAVDPITGKSLFGDQKIEDVVEKLYSKNLHALVRLQEACLKLNGLTDEGVEATKNV